jgi:hypothetical protein
MTDISDIIHALNPTIGLCTGIGLGLFLNINVSEYHHATEWLENHPNTPFSHYKDMTKRYRHTSKWASACYSLGFIGRNAAYSDYQHKRGLPFS